jgi:hypothetical protein
MRTEPTQRQLDLASRVADMIMEHNPGAEATVTTKSQLVFVSCTNHYKWYFLEVGPRGRITNLHTKKSVSFNHVKYEYRI